MSSNREVRPIDTLGPSDGIVASTGDLLTETMERYLAELEAGGCPDRDAFVASFPEIAEELRAALKGIELIYSVAPHLTADPMGGGSRLRPLATLGDFRIVGELGRGGMGVVFEADQLSMGRKVALKVLPFAAMVEENSLKRFQNEVRAAAGLDHPNIVTVYSFGEQRGVHYYAMQLIRGQSLADVIDQQYDKDASRPANSPSGAAASDPSPCPPTSNVGEPLSNPARPDSESQVARETVPEAELSTFCTTRSHDYHSAARLGIQAAEALAHAHEQGVIHRDIKPGNLLLDARGKLWVTDFGLAHIGAEGNLTMTGDVLGTTRYMSPEQTLANRGVIDHRSDIYSLGATLYELLTGRPAFDGDNRQAVLRQIATEEPTRPRHLDPAIPVEIETIVLKAMAKDPADRYATAQEMADDLRRYLEHEPIHARRATVWQRTTKWCQRHPAWVIAGAVCGVLTVLVLTTAVALITRAQSQTLAERNEADHQRYRATRNYELARQTVDRMYSRVADGVFTDQLAPTELQRDLLEEALAFYEESSEENSDSLVSLADQGAAFLKLSHTTNELEQFKRSEAAARRAIEIYEDLAARQADDPRHRLHLARAWRYRAYTVGAMQGSLCFPSAHIDNSAAVLEKLIEDHPTFAEGYEELARTIHHLARRAELAGNRAAAEKVFRRAAQLIERSAVLGNTSSRLRVTRGYHRKGFGDFLAREDPRAGEALLREAVAIAAAMVEEDPDRPDYLDELNCCYTFLASALERMRRYEEANHHYCKAKSSWRELATKYPRVSNYRLSLSRILFHEVWQLIIDGDYKEAESLCGNVIEMLQTIQASSSSPRIEMALAASHETLAYILAHQGRFGDALVESEQGLTLLEGLVAALPRDANFTSRLAQQRHQVAALLLVTKIFDDRTAARARALARSAVDADPKSPAYRWTLRLANLRTGHWLGSSFSDELSTVAQRNRLVLWSMAAVNLKLGRLETASHWMHTARSTSPDTAAPVPASSSE